MGLMRLDSFKTYTLVSRKLNDNYSVMNSMTNLQTHQNIYNLKKKKKILFHKGHFCSKINKAIKTIKFIPLYFYTVCWSDAQIVFLEMTTFCSHYSFLLLIFTGIIYTFTVFLLGFSLLFSFYFSLLFKSVCIDADFSSSLVYFFSL